MDASNTGVKHGQWLSVIGRKSVSGIRPKSSITILSGRQAPSATAMPGPPAFSLAHNGFVSQTQRARPPTPTLTVRVSIVPAAIAVGDPAPDAL